MIRDLAELQKIVQNGGSQPEPFRVALTKLGASVDEAVVIGTALPGLRAARRLGLPFIAVGPAIPPYGHWADAGAAVAFAEFAELRASLSSLFPAGDPGAGPGKPVNRDDLVLSRDQHVAA